MLSWSANFSSIWSGLLVILYENILRVEGNDLISNVNNYVCVCVHESAAP